MSDSARKAHGLWLLTPDDIFTVVEVRAIQRYLDQRLAAALARGRGTAMREWLTVLLPLHTGLRVAEVAGLCCGDLFLAGDAPMVLVRSGKGGKPRCVKISRRFRDQLKFFLDWKAQTGQTIDPGAPLLSSPRAGRPLAIRSLQAAFTRVLGRAGVPKRNNYHMARHSFATHLLRASKGNLIFVRDQLGHSSIKVTEIYLHLIPGEDQRALERLYALT